MSHEPSCESCSSCENSCVRHVPVFACLSEHEVHLLHQAVQSTSYRKGEFVFREGDPANSLYIVHQGVLKIAKLSSEGKEHILRFLFPGDFTGQFALFKEDLQYADAQVLEDATVCRVQRNDVFEIMERNPEIAHGFLAAMSERLREADESMGAITLYDVNRRLARSLLMFAINHEEAAAFSLPIAKKDLAASLGISPETLSRKLALFEARRVLSLQGRKQLTILNAGELSEIAAYGLA